MSVNEIAASTAVCLERVHVQGVSERRAVHLGMGEPLPTKYLTVLLHLKATKLKSLRKVTQGSGLSSQQDTSSNGGLHSHHKALVP